MRRLLWVGDAGCPSGFATATHGVLETLHYHFRVTVLGLNYRGDPNPYPYPLWAAAAGGDSLGVKRLVWLCDHIKHEQGGPPDVIIVQNDGWHIPYYVDRLRMKLPNGEYAFPEYAAIPIVAVVAVDGKNFRKEWLNGVSLAVFWTKFALREAREAGYKGRAAVIPLGVNLDLYKPLDKAGCRSRRLLPVESHDAFIVGNVNRNQSRKVYRRTPGRHAR